MLENSSNKKEVELNKMLNSVYSLLDKSIKHIYRIKMFGISKLDLKINGFDVLFKSQPELFIPLYEKLVKSLFPNISKLIDCSKTNVLAIDITAKRYGVLPSEIIMKGFTDFERYNFDLYCAQVGIQKENQDIKNQNKKLK
jgi:hypothetical protein